MYEFVAILVGVCVGAGFAVTRSPLTRAALIVAGIAGAIGAFALSGESELSPAFLLWDLTQVMLAAVLAAVVVGRVKRRSARS